jgi:Zn-finger nucleic acid-binding protein
VQCPVCSDVQLAISSREGVEIDHCPQCRGVWLDRGELDKILDRVAATPVPPPPQQPQPAAQEPRRDDRRDDRDRGDDRRRYDDDDDRYRKKKRRGGFLEDLFDFD